LPRRLAHFWLIVWWRVSKPPTVNRIDKLWATEAKRGGVKWPGLVENDSGATKRWQGTALGWPMRVDPPGGARRIRRGCPLYARHEPGLDCGSLPV